jgi:hypothetical protein
MPSNPTSGTPAASRPRLKACRSCRSLTVAGRLVAGVCPDCAGLVPLPLRGEGGRFLPGLTGRRSPGESGR